METVNSIAWSRLLEIERAARALLDGPTTPISDSLTMVASDRLNWLKEACRVPSQSPDQRIGASR